MADAQHLDLLTQGVSAWNLWRFDQQEPSIDLSGADLSGRILDEIDLSHANLSQATLLKTSLTHANLSGADLSQANLSGSDLRGADLTQANLKQAILTRADLSEAILLQANLTRADLRAARVLHGILSQAQLTGACIQDWTLNSQTQLEGLACRYIFLKYDPDTQAFVDRRPMNKVAIFRTGEFQARLKKSLDNTEQIFKEKISQPPQNGLARILTSVDNHGLLFALVSALVTAALSIPLTRRYEMRRQLLRPNPLDDLSGQLDRDFEDLRQAIRSGQGTDPVLTLLGQTEEQAMERLERYLRSPAQAMRALAQACEWRFGRDNGETIAPGIQLIEDGSIRGHTNDNERSWSIREGNIVFLNTEDQITSNFKQARLSPEGTLFFTSQLFQSESRGEFAHELECLRILDSDGR